MATITVTPGHTYGPTDTVTSTNLNDLGDPAVALDTGTIVNADISASADIAGSKLLDSSVTKAKIEDVADMKVLGNTSGSAAAPQEVSVLDEDDMSSDSDTALATQQSIKAYVDAPKDKCLVGITSNLSASISPGSFYTVPFNREISDVANMHDNATNNSRVTIGTDGIYLITATIGTNETSNGDICIAIAKNNSEVVRVKFDTGSTDDGQSINISHMDSLSASDYIEVRLVNISGLSTTINTRTFLSVAELA